MKISTQEELRAQFIEERLAAFVPTKLDMEGTRKVRIATTAAVAGWNIFRAVRVVGSVAAATTPAGAALALGQFAVTQVCSSYGGFVIGEEIGLALKNRLARREAVREAVIDADIAFFMQEDVEDSTAQHHEVWPDKADLQAVHNG